MKRHAQPRSPSPLQLGAAAKKGLESVKRVRFSVFPVQVITDYLSVIPFYYDMNAQLSLPETLRFYKQEKIELRAKQALENVLSMTTSTVTCNPRSLLIAYVILRYKDDFFRDAFGEVESKLFDLSHALVCSWEELVEKLRDGIEAANDAEAFAKQYEEYCAKLEDWRHSDLTDTINETVDENVRAKLIFIARRAP